MEDKKTFIDYLTDKKEYYEKQIEICKKYVDKLDPCMLDFKSYRWQINDYEARLDCINDLLGAVKPKD